MDESDKIKPCILSAHEVTRSPDHAVPPDASIASQSDADSQTTGKIHALIEPGKDPVSSLDAASVALQFSQALNPPTRIPGPAGGLGDEALELSPYDRSDTEQSTRDQSCSSISGAREKTGNHGPSQSGASGINQAETNLFRKLPEFWEENVSLNVPGNSARDHLALERTFLAWHRTSLVFALSSTVVTQLYVLNHKPNPDPVFGFYVLGKPLAASMVCLAIGFSIVGFLRWWKWQHALVRGKGITGGWEIEGVGLMVIVYFSAVFGLVLGIGIDKMYFS
ncbi:hypothetical protein BDZ91DRAFT_720757 [Kalaharituber pfeilii]|nr:hypothetical protein BDZ91DRAFT_720757 [Kalaharituber pfeilii]